MSGIEDMISAITVYNPQEGDLVHIRVGLKFDEGDWFIPRREDLEEVRDLFKSVRPDLKLVVTGPHVETVGVIREGVIEDGD